ncbi:MAG: hypothetical protein WC058_13230, partial [Phycisphaeraceae bacterium]
KTAFLTQKRGLQEPKSTFFVSFHWLTLIIGSKTAILRERLPSLQARDDAVFGGRPWSMAGFSKHSIHYPRFRKQPTDCPFTAFSPASPTSAAMCPFKERGNLGTRLPLLPKNILPKNS